MTFSSHEQKLKKYLKGQLAFAPRDSDITFLDHQGGELGPRVSDVPFLIIKKVSWGPT